MKIKPIYTWKSKPARIVAVFTMVPIVVSVSLMLLPLAMVLDTIAGLFSAIWYYMRYLAKIPVAGYYSAKQTITGGYHAIKSNLEA